MLIITSLPTINRQDFGVAFNKTPKSWRLMVVVAEAARWGAPITVISGVGPLTSSTTSLVTPCSVRLPVTFHLPSVSGSILTDLKVMVGYFATSRKSGLFR